MATTRHRTVARVWLWRWRRNPLLRRSDRLEAWLLLVTGVFVVLFGVLAGWAATHAVEHELAVRGARSHPVRAVLAEDAARAPRAVPAYGGGSVWAKVHWRAAGAEHTGLAQVQPGLRTGTSVTVWTGRDGELVSRPATEAQARVQAQIVGSLTGIGAAGVVLAGQGAARRRLERHRMRAWDREWESVGPRWRRTTG
ncbi:hypothetical protein [Streptomyces sp. NPDC047009]|uniref:Rv1733c family protein n=1 Tax=unclassified Streptomyces TaxID=2593676 RepID=UPI0033D3A579